MRRGEILGIAGVLGSGRSELLHAIFGADPEASGGVTLDGVRVGRWPDEAVAAGIALVPEDRARQGYIPALTLAENIALPRARGTLVDRARDHAAAEAAIARLAIKAPGPDALPTELSGGNAQKVVIAKWLSPNTRVLLLDEPTAGIDIGARTDILALLRSLRTTDCRSFSSPRNSPNCSRSATASWCFATAASSARQTPRPATRPT